MTSWHNWVMWTSAIVLGWLSGRFLRKRYPKLFGLKPPPPPVIETEYGPTTEWARKQAAINMKANPVTKRAVEDKLTQQFGSTEAGLAESRRRYPEAYS